MSNKLFTLILVGLLLGSSLFYELKTGKTGPFSLAIRISEAIYTKMEPEAPAPTPTMIPTLSPDYVATPLPLRTQEPTAKPTFVPSPEPAIVPAQTSTPTFVYIPAGEGL